VLWTESLIRPIAAPFGRTAAHPFRNLMRPKEPHGEIFSMNERTVLVEMILAGFFAVACIRASVPLATGKLSLGNLLHLPGRIERLRRSRWQWFSMIALLLVIRMQMGVPIVLEAVVAIQFLIFLALPAASVAAQGARKE